MIIHENVYTMTKKKRILGGKKVLSIHYSGHRNYPLQRKISCLLKKKKNLSSYIHAGYHMKQLLVQLSKISFYPYAFLFLSTPQKERFKQEEKINK